MTQPLTLVRVVDVETTGLEDPAEMVEVGWTDVRHFPTGWAIESGPHSVLVNPGMKISFGAMAIHHITEEMAVAGIQPDAAKSSVLAGADILCAHGAEFDSRFIGGRTIPWICTLKGSHAAWPDMESHSNGAIRYARELCLYDAAAYPPHRAGPDTWITAHILLDLLAEIDLEKLLELSVKPIRLLKMPFGEHFGKRWSEVPDSYLDWIIRKLADDPKKADAVHTARIEIARRRAEAPADVQTDDPDAWRSQMRAF